jgi:hypothetical protein
LVVVLLVRWHWRRTARWHAEMLLGMHPTGASTAGRGHTLLRLACAAPSAVLVAPPGLRIGEDRTHATLDAHAWLRLLRRRCQRVRVRHATAATTTHRHRHRL